MDTERLRFFCTIVETGSLTGASQLLGISHSGLSKAMSALEGELKVKLFRPLGRGLEVTEEGRQIYQRSQQVLQAVAALKVSPARTSESLKIGLPEVFAAGGLGRVLSQLVQDRPMEVLLLNAGELETRIRDREVAFGVTFVPVPQEGIEYLKILSARMAVFTRRGCFEEAPFESIPFAVPASQLPDNPQGIVARDGWPDGAAPRLKAYRASLLTTAIDLARSGSAAVFMPVFVARSLNELSKPEHQLVELPTPRGLGKLVRDVYLVKSKSAEESPEMKRMGKLVRLFCSESAREPLSKA